MLDSSYYHYINPTCFREYDIRGIVGKTLFVQDAFYIGKAFGTYIAENSPMKTVLVGFDGRTTSPNFAKELSDGLNSVGVKVIDIGICPTPMLYYATYTSGITHGVMVTGSHNKPDYNGFKFVFDKRPYSGEALKALQHIIANNKYKESEIVANKRFDPSISDNYISNLYSSLVFGNSNPKVVWDVSNGAGSKIVQIINSVIPGSHHIINGKIDGLFPGHDPDPTIAKNLSQLVDYVLKKNCDVGIALDGDADRVVVVDKLGRIIQGDQLVAIMAQYMVQKHPGMRVVLDIKSGQSIFEYIQNLGAVPLLWKSGHSYIKEKLSEIGAILAGEVSGHLFFADRYYGFDDGIYGALRVIEILSHGYDLAEMLNKLPKTFITPEVRIECDDEKKFEVIEEIKQRLIESGRVFNDIDGIRVESDYGWWLLRASNTQPALVLRFEAKSQANMEKIHKEIKQELYLSNVTVSIAL